MVTVGLAIVLLLVTVSIFVNGWTDSPNAIATVVSTRVLSPKKAVLLAAVFNLLGVVLMGSAVAETTVSIVEYGSDPTQSLVILGAAQLSIVVWAVSAWKYGIPTSESHALIAGLMGAAIALNGWEAFRWSEFRKVLIGLFISSVVGFLAGIITTKGVVAVFKNANRAKANKFFSLGQIASAALMAFNHGAQDGQKFMGVFTQVLIVGGLISSTGGFQIPLWVMIYASAIMAIGTSIGGYRIIKTMGMDMVRLEKYQGFAAEIGASACMMVATWLGIPLSTTNTKGTALMGAGAAKKFSDVNWGIAKEMILAWVLTFPACLILGFLMAKFFALIF